MGLSFLSLYSFSLIEIIGKNVRFFREDIDHCTKHIILILIICLRMLIMSFRRGRRGYESYTPTPLLDPFSILSSTLPTSVRTKVLLHFKGSEDSLKYHFFCSFEKKEEVKFRRQVFSILFPGEII